jgi:hypothetical protein
VSEEATKRRASDQILPMLIQRLDRADELTDEWRRTTDAKHTMMLEKLELLPLLKMSVDANTKWIDGDGKDTVKTVARAKWVVAGLALAGGGIGAWASKILAALTVGGGL